MKTVWMVFETEEYEKDRFLRAFSTEAKAHEFVVSRPPLPSDMGYLIEEIEVDPGE